MSQSERRIARPATGTEAVKDGAEDKNLRFTPLRSYVNRARALTQDAKSELTLSRLVPVARLQS